MGNETTIDHRARELFLEALEKTDRVAQAAFLDATCGSQALRAQVDDLLREQEKLGNFLETPASDARDSTPPPTGPTGTALSIESEQPGDWIGPYKILQQIGEGGCGVVYMAEQEKPVRRRVALKVIKLGMDTRSVIARFEAERQALAMMDHPNIAKVLDAGSTETGRPYFVMELVRGIRITEYCDQNNVATPERLQLFMEVCHAIQHAHQKGIIHRDIKPSNILVTLHDSLPVPKVIDFGIAKATEQRLTDKTLFTKFQSFIGTPAYMSPEQAEMSGLDIDTRSDIYSLGVLLYELLIGRTPFDAATLLSSGLDECRRTIREVEPIRPSTRLAAMFGPDLTTTARQRHTEAPRLINLLKGDLDWIAMKCLEKDRTRRYETASELALDIQRYLDNEPVLARPPSNLYRLQKMVRRHRGVLAATAGIMVTLIAGAGLSAWQAVRALSAEQRARDAQQQEAVLRQDAERERQRAEVEKSAAHLNEYVADINLAQQALTAGNLGRAVQLLEKHRGRLGQPDPRGFEWRYLWELGQGDEHIAFPKQEGGVDSLAISPDGELVAIGQREKVQIWSIRTKLRVASLPKGSQSIVFSHDGKLLITAGGTVRIWRTSDWVEQKSLPENYVSLGLSPDSTRLATMSREGVVLWDTATWEQLRLFPGTAGPIGPIVFSPDGKTLATESRAGIALWSLLRDEPPVILQDSTNVLIAWGPRFRVSPSLAFSPDGKSVVAARNHLSERGVFVLSIWDARTGEETAVMPSDPKRIEHTGVIWSLAFSPDGRTLATASWDHLVRLWDFPSQTHLATFQAHLTEVTAVAFSPDGQSIISAGKDGNVKLWASRLQTKEQVLGGGWEPVTFSKDSRTLAAYNRQGKVAFVNMSTREPEEQFQVDAPRFGFSPLPSASADLSLLAHAQPDGSVKLWNTDARESTSVKVSGSRIDFVSLSPDGNFMLAGGRDRPIRLLEVDSPTNSPIVLDAHRAQFSGDGRTLVAFHRENGVQVWDLASRSLRTNLVLDPIPGFGTSLSRNGHILAAATGPNETDNAVRLWDLRTGKLLGLCTGHKQSVWSIAFSPDGRTLATASDDSTLKLWNVATLQEVISIRRLGGALRGLLFSPDGQWLVGTSGGGPFAHGGGLWFYHAPLLAKEDLALHEIQNR